MYTSKCLGSDREYTIVGRSVSDNDACVDGTCDVNAMCHNTVPGYSCICLPGYMGNGKICVGTSLLLHVCQLHGDISCSRIYAANTLLRLPKEQR